MALIAKIYSTPFYCKEWGLEINIDTTKVIVCQKKGEASSLRSGTTIIYFKTVDSLNSLSVVINYRGGLLEHTTIVNGKNPEAMNVLMTTTKFLFYHRKQ